jgi:glycolate oxidase FAD binding subunit
VQTAPGTAQEVAAALREASGAGRSVRVRGGASKLGWGNAEAPADVELSTEGLAGIVEHNAGDFTVVAGAGTRLADLQAAVADAGQHLALDPPLGAGEAATLGGVVATADSGPLRHRFGGPRDLVLGVRVALPDGTVARAGGKVIKNVAGYDLGKLCAGAYGTLGVICELSLRLHPIPVATASAFVRGDDPQTLAGAAATLAHRPFEHHALDARWEDGSGMVLARFAGSTAAEQAAAAAQAVDGEVAEADEDLWRAQRAAQRSPDGIVVRVSTLQTRLAGVLAAARDLGGRAVARAGLVVAWVALPAEGGAGAVGELRARLGPDPCVVQDAPRAVREALDPWGPVDPGALALMRRVRERFDPHRTLNPGVYAGAL